MSDGFVIIPHGPYLFYIKKNILNSMKTSKKIQIISNLWRAKIKFLNGEVKTLLSVFRF